MTLCSAWLIYKGVGYACIFRHFIQGKKLCGFLFAFLYINPLLKRGLLQKERICKFFPFRVDPFSEGRQKQFERVVFLEIVSIPLNCSEDHRLTQQTHSVVTTSFWRRRDFETTFLRHCVFPGYPASTWRLCNVVLSWRCFDVSATLYKRRVPAEYIF